jgi:hypothetical protein
VAQPKGRKLAPQARAAGSESGRDVVVPVGHGRTP